MLAHLTVKALGALIFISWRLMMEYKSAGGWIMRAKVRVQYMERGGVREWRDERFGNGFMGQKV